MASSWEMPCTQGWQHSYAELHAAYMNGTNTTGGAVLHLCRAGLADCMVGSVTVFYFALLTGRAFFRHHGEVRGMRPNAINWSIEWDQIHQARQEVPDTVLLGEALISEDPVMNAFAHGDLSDVGRGNATVILHTNAGLVHRLFDNPNYRRRLRDMGLRPDTAFACAVQFLYKLRPEAQQLLAHEFEVVSNTQQHFSIGVHVRVGDHAMGVQGATVNQTEADAHAALSVADLLQQHQQVFDCVQHIEASFAPPGKQVFWFLLSDSLELRQAVREKYGPKVLTKTELPVEHVVESNGGKGASQEGHYLAAAEWWLFGMTDFQVIVHGGYGRTAALAKNNWDSVYMVGSKYKYRDTLSNRELKTLGKCKPQTFAVLSKMAPGI